MREDDGKTLGVSITWQAGLTFLAALYASGCSLDNANIAELKRLCERDGGLEVHDTVEVEGFFHSTGAFSLIDSDYLYIEDCIKPGSPRKLLPIQGCFRLSKVSREKGDCYKPLDERFSRAVVDPYPEFMATHCLALEHIDKPEAEYGYYESYDSWVAKNGHSKFAREQVRIENLRTGDVLATYANYSLYREPGQGYSISCDHVMDGFPSYSETKLISRVLMPTR